VGSLTGAVASQIVTEAFKGRLAADGNRSDSANAKAGLTARLASRADAKAEVSDPTTLSGKGEAHRTKVTLGITG
jgi:hypothetical protein